MTESEAGYLFVLLFVFLPLGAGVVAAVTGRGGTAPLGLCAVLSLAGALRLLAGEEAIRLVLLGSYGVELLLDRVAATFIFANAAVCLAVALHLRNGSVPSLLVPVMTMLSGTANAVFLSYDLFNIFVAVDLSTILGFLLIRMGRKPRQIWSSIKYLFVHNLGMIFYLLGCLDVYRQTGTFSLSALSGAFPSAVVLLMGGLVVKGGLFLPGLWLPEAHGEADAPVSALLSGVVVKIGLAPLLRIAGENEAARGLLLVLGPAAALWGVLHALFEKDAKRLLAYHTLSQVGFIAAVPSVGHLYAAAHGLFKSWLFLSVGRLPTRRLAALSREAVSRPLWGVLVLGSLAISGCPPLAGFGAKLRVMGGALSWQEPLLLLAAVGTAASFAKFLFLPRKGAPFSLKDPEEKELSSPLSPVGGMAVPSRGAGIEDVWLGAALFGMGLFLGGFEVKEIVKAVLVLGGGWGDVRVAPGALPTTSQEPGDDGESRGCAGSLSGRGASGGADMVLLIGAGTCFWIVVSGDLSLRGVLLGCAFSVFAGRFLGLHPEAGRIFRFAVRLLRTLPRAFLEGIELMTGHFSVRRFVPQKAPPSSWSVFEEVYLVTLTPRTLVVHVDRLRTMLVHCLDEEKRG